MTSSSTSHRYFASSMVILRTKGEPHGTVADLLRNADAQQHMAGVQAVGVAGRAGGCADVVHIQIQQRMVSPLQAGEADVRIARQAVLQAAVQAGLRDVLEHAVNDVITQLFLVGHPLVQMGDGHFQGLAHTGDTGHVLGAGAVAGLLAAAVDQVLGPDALAAVQCAHALGAIELSGRSWTAYPRPAPRHPREWCQRPAPHRCASTRRACGRSPQFP